jgi:TRAP-type C4-dicarboxylate transport system substrate-binding protein
MKKLVFLSLSLILVIGLLLAGCGGSATPAPATSAAPTSTSAPPKTTSAPQATSAAPTGAPPAGSSPAGSPSAPAGSIPNMSLTFNGAQFSAADVPGQEYNWFCNQVTQKTNGAVKFSYVGSTSLTKPGEEITALQNGIVEVGALSLVYFPAQFYINSGFTRAVPFDITDIPTANKAAYGLYYDNAASSKALEAEFTKQGLKFLCMTIDDSYIIESKAPITKLDDLKGKKLACLGAEGVFFKPTGATVIGMPNGDRPTALQTGVLDAGAGPYTITFTNRTFEFAPYMIQTGFGCVTGNAVAWNLNKFNALPKSLQDILVQAGKDTFMQNSTIAMNWFTGALDTRAKSSGNKPVSSFSDDDLAKWANLVGEPVLDWIKAAPANSGADTVASAWIAAEKAAGYKFPKEWKTQ